jgi:hypothetical protein
LEPARGLNNYFSGAFADFFFTGAVSDYPFANNVVYAVLALMFAVVALKWLSPAVTFAILLFFPGINGLSEIDLVVTIFILACAWAFSMRNVYQNHLLLAVLGSLVVIFAPGQGALALASVFVALALVKDIPLKKRLVAAALFLAVQLLCLAAPVFGTVYFGALRYGFEQFAMNSVANGIEWASTVGASGGNIWFFEITRASWIAVPAIFLTLLLALHKRISLSPKSYFLGISLTVLTVMFVVRAAGRIDPSLSRMGIAAIWFFAILMPIFYFAVLRQSSNVKFVTAVFAVLGLLVPSLSSGIIDQPPLARLRAALTPQTVSPSTFENARETNQEYPWIGTLLLDAEKKSDLEGLDAVIDSVSGDSGTYLDLTNHAANYAYLRRVPPIAVPAVYNLISQGQQLRAIQELEEKKPAIFLVSDSNISHDGGWVWGLRSPLLFRWVLQQQSNYAFMRDDSRIWLVENSMVPIALKTTNLQMIAQEKLPFELSEIWNVPDLMAVPISWGKSIETLSQHLDAPYKISTILGSDAISFEGKNIRVTGSDPFIRFGLRKPLPTRGEVQYLKFQFGCAADCSRVKEGTIYWSGPGVTETEDRKLHFRLEAGTLLVPLFASSFWTFENQSIEAIRLDFDGAPTGSVFSVSDLEIVSLAN